MYLSFGRCVKRKLKYTTLSSVLMLYASCATLTLLHSQHGAIIYGCCRAFRLSFMKKGRLLHVPIEMLVPIRRRITYKAMRMCCGIEIEFEKES